MANNYKQSNTNSKCNNKRLALIKIVKVDLTKENDNDEDIEYSPAYISTTNNCVNSGTVSSDIHFQLLGMFN